MAPRIKYIFVQERKAMFLLIKKLFLSLKQFDVITHPLLYFAQMSVFSFHTFLFSYISL